MIQDVFIIGATGRVGKTLARQILEKGDTDSSIHANPTRIVGLASSSSTIFSFKGIPKNNALEFLNGQYKKSSAYNSFTEFIEIASRQHKMSESTLAFIDLTSLNEPMTKFHLEVIQNTDYGIATANKNPVALSSYETFQLLTRNPRRYGYRCSVMAGAEAVPFLRDLKDLNDNLKSIQGCFSGTLSYITSELEIGKSFSAIVREAHSKGYTEPHPRDDLSGIDVARKIVVLARTAGYEIGIDDVSIKPFVPKKYLSENNIEIFLKNLSELDETFKERVKQAEKYNATLRYIAIMEVKNEKVMIEVALKEVPKQSQLGSLYGTMNKIVIVSESYPNGYSIEAPGAGLEVTARNIRRDLLDLLPERKVAL